MVTFSCSVTAYFWISPCLNHFDFIVYKSLASTWLQYFPNSDLSVLVQYVVWNRTDLFPMWCLLDRAQTHLVSTWRCYSAPRKTISVRIPRKISLGRRSFLVLRCCILHLKLDEMPVALKCNFNVKLNVFGYIFRLSSWGFSIEYYGGGKRISCKQAAGFLLPVNELLWFGTRCKGGCGVRQSCWRLAVERLVGLHVRCLQWSKAKHELKHELCGWLRVALTLEPAAWFCVACDLASTVPVVSGFEDAFFLSWHTDLKGVVTLHIT